ncbi:MAG TPA: acyl-CoA dehydrogenase family protein, partial [Gammaproteobacteria bacterium]|nr:acyl-CoA dehydrogenase family protein [Gammaproteobacteria bacterium]
YNADATYDISIDKKIITNVGASDLLFVNLAVSGGQSNKFVIVLFENDEIPQRSISDKLAGLTSCPSGSLRVELVKYKDIKIVAEGNKSLLVMRLMYNMERFLIGGVIAGILKKILYYALQETDLDTVGKFNNQYLQDKVIAIFSYYTKLDSLIKNCIQLMNHHLIVEPILSLIKIACIDDVHDAIIKLKEIYGAKSYANNHVTAKLLRDHEAIYNLGGTKELMKQTLYNNLKNKKTRNQYV